MATLSGVPEASSANAALKIHASEPSKIDISKFDVEEFLRQEEAKDLLRFTTAGSVDDGKSTLIGRLLHDARGAYEDQLKQAIRGGEHQSSAVAMFQWTGPYLQAQIVPWTQIKDEASANAVASIIETTPRRLFGGGTSISGAIDYSMRWFPQSPFKGERHVIDISGDGSNNGGRSVIRARDEAVAADVNINGLPILAWEPYLDTYYKENVIGGPGAFMIVAKDFDAFSDAILKKMIIEIARNVRPRPTRIGKR